MTAMLVAACPSPGGGGNPPPEIAPPPEVALTFEQAAVRKSKMLVSANGDAPQTYTNTLRLGTTPVPAGAVYRISANPGGHTPEEISVDAATGEVTFTKALYDKMTPSDLTRPPGPPAVITIEATYQGKTASYTFTVTDHFRKRGDHASVVVGNDLYVIGGQIQQFSLSTTIGAPPAQLAINSNEVWRSSDKGLTWTQVAGDARFTPRRSHGSVVLGEDIYVIGGLYGDDGLTPRDDVWRSTDKGVSWSRVTPAGRNVEFPMDHFFASAVLGDTIYVMGGIRRTPFTRLDQVWQSTDRGVSWTEATNATDPKFSARSGAAAVVLGSAGAAKLYVIGGSSGGSDFNDVWESGDGTSWTHLNASAAASDTFSARSEHSAAVLGDAVYVIAGNESGATRNNIWKSTDMGATWAQVVTSGELFPRRTGLSSVAQGGALYVIGGIYIRGNISPNALFDRVWKSTDGGVTWVNVHKNP